MSMLPQISPIYTFAVVKNMTSSAGSMYLYLKPDNFVSKFLSIPKSEYVDIFSDCFTTIIDEAGRLVSLQVKINEQLLNLIEEAIDGANIDSCDAHVCSRRPCANGGRCIPLKQSYTCVCQPGFNDANCTDSTPFTSFCSLPIIFFFKPR